MDRRSMTRATNTEPGGVVEVRSEDDAVQQYLTPATADKAGELITVQGARASEQQFAAPTPYFDLTQAERDTLEAERTQLLGSLPTLSVRDRLLAEERIQRIEADLKRSRSGDESA